MSVRGTGNGTLEVKVLSSQSWSEQRRHFLEEEDLFLDNHGDFDVPNSTLKCNNPPPQSVVALQSGIGEG